MGPGPVRIVDCWFVPNQSVESKSFAASGSRDPSVGHVLGQSAALNSSSPADVAKHTVDAFVEKGLPLLLKYPANNARLLPRDLGSH